MTTKKSLYYDTLVLSGASTKGIMMLGSLQCALDNYFIKDVKNFVGVSSGSMICYLLCIGYTPTEIMTYITTNQILDKIQHFNLVAMTQGRGASSFSPIQEQLEKMTIDKIGFLPTLNDIKTKLNKNFIICTHNITTNETEYLSVENNPDLPCLIGIRMSANLPLLFENFKYGNSHYVDGGISDNFPIDIGEKIGEKVLGITITSDDDHDKDTNFKTIEFIYKLMFIPINKHVDHKIKNCSSEKCTILKLSEDSVKFFDFNISASKKLDMFSKGYNAMKEKLNL